MKRYYFSKNPFTHEYYLDSGAFGARREVLGTDSDFIAHYFKKKIDKKRNTLLFLVEEDLSKEEIKNIRKFFSESKVKVSLDSLANLEG